MALNNQSTMKAITEAEFKKIMDTMKAHPAVLSNNSLFTDHLIDAFKYSSGKPGGLGSGAMTNNKVEVRVPKTQPSLLSMIASRMRWSEGAKVPFDWIDPHEANDGKIVVFMIVEGRALMMYDDAALFPSDTFITQLRLLEAQ